MIAEVENNIGTAKTPPTKIEVKAVKHVFTAEERNQIGGDLARAIANLRGTEAEFDQVKASYKARTTESEARIDALSTQLMNGFDVRNTRCRVEYRPKERKKAFFLETAEADAEPVLIEDMTHDDFAIELLQAESKFECREEITLFPPTETDGGILVVGRFEGRWFAALRINVGGRKLEERLDSEQKSVKKRADAVKQAAKRAHAWLIEALGKDNAKGFEGLIITATEAHKEREE